MFGKNVKNVKSINNIKKVKNFKNFSFTHNLHSPSKYYIKGIEYVFDNTTDEYSNKFIRAFLNKRRMIKKQICKFW